MKKVTWILALAVVGIIAVPSVVYAVDYLDEYEVTVNLSASSEALGVIYITELETSVEPMDWLSFWDVLKGHSTGEDREDYYFIGIEITQDSSGEVATGGERIVLAAGEAIDLSMIVFEVSPGDSTLRIYVDSLFTGGIIYDQSSNIVVG